MTQAALSAAQFGSGSPVEPLHEQPPADDGNIPLPYSTQTNSSPKAASVWRKPRRNLPLSQATSGSFFQPYGATE